MKIAIEVEVVPNEDDLGAINPEYVAQYVVATLDDALKRETGHLRALGWSPIGNARQMYDAR